MKNTVVDKASGRLITAGREEIDAVQPLLEILIDEAGWSANQIVSRPHQWKVPSSPSQKRQWPVDIAIFDQSSNVRNPQHVIILCECKRPDITTGIEQLKIYLDREPHAKVGIWFNGIEHAIVYKTTSGYQQAPPGAPILTKLDPLVPFGGKPLVYSDLRKAPSLIPVFKRIRDRLATLDLNVNRDEEILPDISLLLLLKILDEQTHRFTPAKQLSFQIDASPQETGERLRTLLADQVARNPQLFGSSDAQLSVDDNSIYYVVETLQNYQLLSNDADAVSQAFQVIRGKAYKGEEGQYFTPSSVVRVAIAAIDPKPSDRVIDPACGSGSFLADALNNVVEKLTKLSGNNDPASVTLAKRDWATTQLYAIDKDAVSVRLSKAFLSMLGDGSTHVFKADSVRPSTWMQRTDNLAAIIQDGSFDVVVANPPFGTKLKITPEITQQEKYDVARKWVRRNGKWEITDKYVPRELGLIFLERCLRLLCEGGRLAIVLPDTYLFSDSYGWLVEWLTSQFTVTHSINVPIEAFEPHCRAKTSILVLRKSPPAHDNEIIGSLCETYGEDKHGRTRYQFTEGIQTDEVDDEMQLSAQIMRAGTPTKDSKLHFTFTQSESKSRGVLVASYYWRKPYHDALENFAQKYDCQLISIGQLEQQGELEVFPGHGSPSSHFHGKGSVPYIKVVDIKNWRIVENPNYYIPTDIATKFRKNRPLEAFDIVTPTRASKNIGLFGVVLPWQTHVILTREIAIWRVPSTATLIDPFLLLTLMSLEVVHAQFRFVVMMQTNREDLGNRYKEILIPLPNDLKLRQEWTGSVKDYFHAIVHARESYSQLTEILDVSLFADRP